MSVTKPTRNFALHSQFNTSLAYFFVFTEENTQWMCKHYEQDHRRMGVCKTHINIRDRSCLHLLLYNFTSTSISNYFKC
jgi:hypothetical protein